MLFFYLSFFLSCFSATSTTSSDSQRLPITDLKCLGDSYIISSNSIITLTQDPMVPNSGVGRVLWNQPVRFPASFTTRFSFAISSLNPDSIGGGFAFVISPDNESIGAPGGFLGIPEGSVAVEFDNSMDVEFNDVNANHVGLDINSMVSTQIANLDLFNINLRSGYILNSWVEYSELAKQLNVFVSHENTKPELPVLSVFMNLSQYMNEFMFIGFTGSTQGSSESHSLHDWSFSTSWIDDHELESNSSPSPPSATLWLVVCLIVVIILLLVTCICKGRNIYCNICNFSPDVENAEA